MDKRLLKGFWSAHFTDVNKDIGENNITEKLHSSCNYIDQSSIILEEMPSTVF